MTPENDKLSKTYPLLAMVESDASEALSFRSHPALASDISGLPLDHHPSPELREAVERLSEVLRAERGGAAGKPLWLLLDTNAAPMMAQSQPSGLEVSRVLDELREKFQGLLGPAGEDESRPDFEGFLRDKLRALGLDDLGAAPLLPELQREALRGLGVGLGSQLSQLLGRLAGWHGEAKAPSGKEDEESKSGGTLKLLRLELGSALAADREGTVELRQQMGKIRRRLSQQLGWEISGLQLAASKDLQPHSWRVLLRGEPVAEGAGLDALAQSLEPLLAERAESLLPFASFEALLRQPGCKLVVKELRALGLEKAALWTVCRRAIAAGGHLREPLTTLERILEASVTSQQLPFLVQAALSGASEV